MFEHLQEQIESLKKNGVDVENEIPWLLENKGRRGRWSKYFTGKNDLVEDRVLKGFDMSPEDMAVLRRQTEVLLDNMTNEARAKSGSLFETTTTAEIETFTTWALPLIRKIWPRLFANQIVSVQPMKGPTGKVFTLDFVYGSAGGAYSSGTSIYANPDYTYSDGISEGNEPKEINLKITGVTLTAIAKKLKALWNQEASQDLASQHGLNLQNEVIKILGMEIEREINRALILGVYDAASTNTTWPASQPASPDPWANATPKEYAESLFDAVNDANKQIFDRVYVNGNFILAGSTFANRLRKVSGFRQIDAAPGDARVVTGPNLFGVLRDQFRVYIDPFFSKDQAIVGHKSNNWMYTGYVYAPYIPMWKTPTIWNTKMQPAQGMMSRYATYAKNGDFFATVTVI